MEARSGMTVMLMAGFVIKNSLAGAGFPHFDPRDMRDSFKIDHDSGSEVTVVTWRLKLHL